MQFLDLTLPTPAENLALDDALLEAVEAGEIEHEVLRVWEAPSPFVVIGRSSKIAEEVDLAHCERIEVPVLRRSSGGAAVVAGPGCLMYAVILRLRERPELRDLQKAHRFVMEHTCLAAQRFEASVQIQGISDLAFGPNRQKCSGNSMRYKRDSLLYHGTLLYDFALEQIVQCLALAPRQPDYRESRSHGDFVANLPADAERLRQALQQAWKVVRPIEQWPRVRTADLVEKRYMDDAWNRSR